MRSRNNRGVLEVRKVLVAKQVREKLCATFLLFACGVIYKRKERLRASALFYLLGNWSARNARASALYLNIGGGYFAKEEDKKNNERLGRHCKTCRAKSCYGWG